jgi:hypothetical protein
LKLASYLAVPHARKLRWKSGYELTNSRNQCNDGHTECGGVVAKQSRQQESIESGRGRRHTTLAQQLANTPEMRSRVVPHIHNV